MFLYTFLHLQGYVSTMIKKNMSVSLFAETNFNSVLNFLCSSNSWDHSSNSQYLIWHLTAVIFSIKSKKNMFYGVKQSTSFLNLTQMMILVEEHLNRQSQKLTWESKALALNNIVNPKRILESKTALPTTWHQTAIRAVKAQIWRRIRSQRLLKAWYNKKHINSK